MKIGKSRKVDVKDWCVCILATTLDYVPQADLDVIPIWNLKIRLQLLDLRLRIK